MIKDLRKFVRERHRVLTGMDGDGDECRWGWLGWGQLWQEWMGMGTNTRVPVQLSSDNLCPRSQQQHIATRCHFSVIVVVSAVTEDSPFTVTTVL